MEQVSGEKDASKYFRIISVNILNNANAEKKKFVYFSTYIR